MNLLLPPPKKKHPTKTIPSFQVRAPSETKKNTPNDLPNFSGPEGSEVGIVATATEAFTQLDLHRSQPSTGSMEVDPRWQFKYTTWMKHPFRMKE